MSQPARSTRAIHNQLASIFYAPIPRCTASRRYDTPLVAKFSVSRTHARQISNAPFLTRHSKNSTPTHLERPIMQNRRFFAATLTLALTAATLLPNAAIAKTSSAWARAGSDSVAVYLTYENTGKKAQTLVGAASPIAKAVEIHHSSPINMGSGSMAMETVHDLVVEPHQQLVFAPGGYHLMLVGLRRKFTLGDRFIVVLAFRDKHREIVSARVQNQ